MIAATSSIYSTWRILDPRNVGVRAGTIQLVGFHMYELRGWTASLVISAIISLETSLWPRINRDICFIILALIWIALVLLFSTSTVSGITSRFVTQNPVCGSLATNSTSPAAQQRHPTCFRFTSLAGVAQFPPLMLVSRMIEIGAEALWSDRNAPVTARASRL